MQQKVPIDLLHEFGGNGPVIHLAHANGFPPSTYKPFAEILTDCYKVIGFPSRPLWPGSRPEDAPNWHVLANDLIKGLDALGLKNIIGIGHSLGGVCTMFATISRPDLFRAILLIDPVILPPNRLRLVKWMRRLGLKHRLPLVQGALRRRRVWPSQEDCYKHWRSKSFFDNWTDDSLWSYVKAGTRKRDDGHVELIYPPEWEAHIFATPPTDVWDYVSKLRTPTIVIRGEYTNVFKPECQSRMKTLVPSARFHLVPEAGHLMPMECPVEVGVVVRSFLEEMP